MTNHITGYVGLDVHKESIAIAVAAEGREAPRFIGTTGPRLGELIKTLDRLGTPQQLRLAYEAGPTGYRLARELGARGYVCEVIAVAQMPRRPGDRIKTDRRDALTLARYLRSGELTPVTIPDERDEAIRDLARAREDAVRARLKARQQLKAMLLRHGHRYAGKTFWTAAHERALAKIRFDHPAQDLAYAEYRTAVQEAHARVERLELALREQVAEWRLAPVVNAIMALRGINFIAAAVILCELGELSRFAHPKQLMSYLGLVPSESSTGESRAQGKITKTGNAHVRRILIESAWTYRYPARMSRQILVRNQSVTPAIQAISWKAQMRLCSRYRRMQARGVHQNKTCVAVARELVGFIWDIAKHTPLPGQATTDGGLTAA
jgi:transposase